MVKEETKIIPKYKYSQEFLINHFFYGIQKIKIDDYIESDNIIYTIVLCNVPEENHYNAKTNGVMRELNIGEKELTEMIQ